MDPRTIHRVLKAKPFAPFRIVLDDGAAHDVFDASDAGVDASMIYIGVDLDEAFGVFRRTIRVSPDRVTRIELLPESTTA